MKRSGITEPPIDLRRIVEEAGLGYEEVDYFPDDVDALIIQFPDRVIAAVNSNQAITRRRFSLAHELCHHLLHQDQSIFDDYVTIDSPPTATGNASSKHPMEVEADIFAGELLVPLSFLKTHFRSGLTAADVARTFAVSEHVASIAITSHFNALCK